MVVPEQTFSEYMNRFYLAQQLCKPGCSSLIALDKIYRRNHWLVRLDEITLIYIINT